MILDLHIFKFVNEHFCNFKRAINFSLALMCANILTLLTSALGKSNVNLSYHCKIFRYKRALLRSEPRFSVILPCVIKCRSSNYSQCLIMRKKSILNYVVLSFLKLLHCSSCLYELRYYFLYLPK